MPLFAAEEPDWQHVIVRFTLGADGKLHVAEQLEVVVPASVATVEREYWIDASRDIQVESITRYDGDNARPLERGNLDIGNRYESSFGDIRWSVRDKLGQVEGPRALTYVLRYTVTDAVAPAWSIPRGEQDPQGNLQYPRKRLRELIPIWREALQKPRSRYLLDFQYDMPPPSTDGTRIQLQLYWDDGWSPVHTITGDTIATEIDRSIGYNDRWRVTHLFDYHRDSVPPAIDLRPHKIRLASILGFPIAAAILWLLFLLRELFRRGQTPAVPEVNEQYVRETVYSEPPEVIAARWSARATYPNLEAFLRRLEREHKIALTIEPRTVTFDGEEMEDDPLVKIRLLVPREELSSYERAGIDKLITTGWEVTSD